METALNQFLRDMGFRVVLDGSHPAVINLGGGSRIQFEDWGDAMLVTLRQALPRTGTSHRLEQYLENLLLLASPAHHHSFQVQPGLVGDEEGTLSIQLDRTEVSNPNLHEAIELLCELNRRARA